MNNSQSHKVAKSMSFGVQKKMRQAQKDALDAFYEICINSILN